MTEIHNDTEFRQKLESLDPVRQRTLAARFVENVLPFCTDERVARVVKVAADPRATADELATALHTAKAAIIDSHARCGRRVRLEGSGGVFRGTRGRRRGFTRGADGRRTGLAGGHEQQNGGNLPVDRQH